MPSLPSEGPSQVSVSCLPSISRHLLYTAPRCSQAWRSTVMYMEQKGEPHTETQLVRVEVKYGSGQ